MLSTSEMTLALNSASEWVDAPLSRAAAPSDAARFSDLLSVGDAQVSAVAPATAPMDPARVHGSAGSQWGDAILSSLNTAGQQYTSLNGRVQQAVNNVGNLSVADLVRLQYEHVSASLMVEIVGKGVSKATQQIDSLVKLQ